VEKFKFRLRQNGSTLNEKKIRVFLIKIKINKAGWCWERRKRRRSS
jgi:type I site-specific restriction endonuclease